MRSVCVKDVEYSRSDSDLHYAFLARSLIDVLVQTSVPAPFKHYRYRESLLPSLRRNRSPLDVICRRRQ